MRPSILLVLFDDLRTMNSSALPLSMPRLDAIAREGTSYALALANYPVCAPSRTMLMTGRFLEYAPASPDEARTVRALAGKTLPHHFRSSGYATYAAGKVFDGVLEGSWDDALPFDPRRTKCRDARSERRNEPVCAPVDETVDAEPAKWLAARLRSHRTGPFLAAFGLRRPHAPWEYAQRNYEAKPLPPSPNFPRDAPLIAWSDNWGRVAKRRGNGGKCPTPQTVLAPRLARRSRAAYAAACRTADAYLGRVLDAAERSSTNLIVAVTADHGMHLGDHGIWSKQTLFDYSLRVPLILKGPGVPRNARVETPVETSRLFATLTALVGLKTPPGIELPLPPFGPHKNAARSVYTRLCKNFESERYATCHHDRHAWPRVVECASSDRIWGRTLRTRRHRYTEYTTSDGRFVSAQLYAYAGSDLDAAALGERRNLVEGAASDVLDAWRTRLKHAFNASSDAVRRRLRVGFLGAEPMLYHS